SKKLPCAPESTLTVDGLPFPVKPAGTQGDLLSGRDLPLRLCFAGRPLLLAGTHDLLAGGVIQTDSLELSSQGNVGVASAPARATPPSLHVKEAGDGGFQVDVTNA